MFSFLTPETVNLLQRVQKIIDSNVVSPRTMNVIFKRINFVIQKELVVQLVIHLSFIRM
jgi:hypothetical protein